MNSIAWKKFKWIFIIYLIKTKVLLWCNAKCYKIVAKNYIFHVCEIVWNMMSAQKYLQYKNVYSSPISKIFQILLYQIFCRAPNLKYISFRVHFSCCELFILSKIFCILKITTTQNYNIHEFHSAFFKMEYKLSV